MLFRNKQKAEGDNQPNAGGEALIGGVLYEIASWTKISKTGDKFQSLSIRPKREPDNSQR